MQLGAQSTFESALPGCLRTQAETHKGASGVKLQVLVSALNTLSSDINTLNKSVHCSFPCMCAPQQAPQTYKHTHTWTRHDGGDVIKCACKPCAAEESNLDVQRCGQ